MLVLQDKISVKACGAEVLYCFPPVASVQPQALPSKQGSNAPNPSSRLELGRVHKEG